MSRIVRVSLVCAAALGLFLIDATPAAAQFSRAFSRTFEIGFEPKSAAHGDLDEDGNVDLVTADFGSNAVTVLLGDGRGGFTPARLVPPRVEAGPVRRARSKDRRSIPPSGATIPTVPVVAESIAAILEPVFVPAIAPPLLPASFLKAPIDLPLVASQPPSRLLLQAPPPRGGLVPLYVSYGVLQGLDVYSTRGALYAGAGREGNPLLRDAAGSSAGLIAVKAASTAVVIWGTERLRKKHRRAAEWTMVGLNAVTAVVVARNYAVTQRDRR